MGRRLPGRVNAQRLRCPFNYKVKNSWHALCRCAMNKARILFCHKPEQSLLILAIVGIAGFASAPSATTRSLLRHYSNESGQAMSTRALPLSRWCKYFTCKSTATACSRAKPLSKVSAVAFRVVAKALLRLDRAPACWRYDALARRKDLPRRRRS